MTTGVSPLGNQMTEKNRFLHSSGAQALFLPITNHAKMQRSLNVKDLFTPHVKFKQLLGVIKVLLSIDCFILL
jgi:hypothetical protein